MIAWCCGPLHKRDHELYMYGICFRNTWSRDKITCVEKDAWAMENMAEIKRLYQGTLTIPECVAVGLGGQFDARQFILERAS